MWLVWAECQNVISKFKIDCSNGRYNLIRLYCVLNLYIYIFNIFKNNIIEFSNGFSYKIYMGTTFQFIIHRIITKGICYLYFCLLRTKQFISQLE